MKKIIFTAFLIILSNVYALSITTVTPTFNGPNVTLLNGIYYAPIDLTPINNWGYGLDDKGYYETVSYNSGNGVDYIFEAKNYPCVKRVRINYNPYYNISYIYKYTGIGGNYAWYPVTNKTCANCPLRDYGVILTYMVDYYPYNSTGNVNFKANNTIVQLITPTTETVCGEKSHLISIKTGYISGNQFERSSNDGMSWNVVSNNEPYFFETNPSQGTILYRVLKPDGAYTSINKVTYFDSIPSATISPDINFKTVGDTIKLKSSINDSRFNYQWYIDNTAIAGETADSITIKDLKSSNSGSYSCLISNGCYNSWTTPAALTVNKAPQVITFPDIPTKTFGDAAFTLPATTDKGQTIVYQSTNTAVATISGNTVTIVAPGTTNIIASQAGTADYLAATGITKTLTVNKISQTITFPAISAKTYGGASFSLPATTDKGLTIAYTSTNTNVATVSGNTVTILNAGSTDIIANQVGTANYYAAPSVSQTLIVNKAAQTITFNAFASKTYGDAPITMNLNSDKGLGITYTSNNTAVASLVSNVLTINKAGTATITATQAGTANYLAATLVTQILTVNKADQTIVWSNIPNKTYGDADFALPASSNKGLTISYVSADPTIATVTGNMVSLKSSGTVNITANQAGNENYNPAANVTLPLSVGKSTQAITFADFPAYTYGAGAVKLSASLVSGAKISYESSDNNVASLSNDTLKINGAGQCYITASASGNANYFTPAPVQKLLTVNKANQTILFDAISDKTYGDAAFGLSAVANTNLPVTFSSSAPAKLIISGNNTTIAGAGSYTVTATQAGNSNYNVATATRTFNVAKASLTATADNKTRLYGDLNPTFTVSFSGFVNGDTKYELATLPVASTTAIATTGVGNYTISLSSVTDANYTLTNRTGLLTINQAPLMVTAQNATKIYGDANPILPLAYSGFKNGETSSVLSALPAASTIAKTMSNVGQYDILVSGGGAQNYALSYTKGQLTINKATLKVYATDASRSYGDANPDFTTNIIGYKGADDISVLDVLPTYSCVANSTSTTGSYPVVYSGGSDDNYLFDFATTVGNLTVTKAPLAVSAQNATKEYGSLNPQFVINYSGFKNNETASVLSTLPSASTTALTMSNVGSYAINVSGGTSANYSFGYTSGKLEITKATLTISAKDISRTYGDSNPSFQNVYTGFKGSDNATVLDVLPRASCIANPSSQTGVYEITYSGGSDNNYNYDLSTTVGKLSVLKAPLNITTKNDTIKLGGSIPVFKLLYSGFKNGDNESLLQNLPTVECVATDKSPIGTYDITLQGGSDKNYDYKLTNGVLVIQENTGINDVNVQSVVLYPIPAKEMLYIKSDVPISKVEIYSLQGQVLQIANGESIQSVNISMLNNGSYLIRLHSNRGSVTKMFIKE